MKRGWKWFVVLGAPLALAAAVPGVAQELKIGVAAEVTSIDPHFHNFGPNNALRQHIFEGLVANNEKQQLIPSLAASWRAVDDRTWEFKLRPNVRFSNGTDFSATDVIYTLCRVPTVENSPSSFTVFTRGIDAIDTPDPLTLVIKTSEPLPLLPNSFAALGVLSAAAYGGGNVVYKPGGCETMGTTPKSAEFNNPAKAIGTGPYKLTELHAWQPRHPGAQRRLLGREAALETGDLATVHERRVACRRAPVGRRGYDRESAHPGSRADQELRFRDQPGHLEPCHLSSHGPVPR